MHGGKAYICTKFFLNKTGKETITNHFPKSVTEESFKVKSAKAAYYLTLHDAYLTIILATSIDEDILEYDAFWAKTCKVLRSSKYTKAYTGLKTVRSPFN